MLKLKSLLLLFFRKEDPFLLLWLTPFLIAAAPQHVISLNLCTDQLLVLLAPRQIAALEPLARDPALSYVARQAATLPSVRNDAEAVLALHPDLVLAGPYAAQTTIAQLRTRAMPIVILPEAHNFTEVAAQISQLAEILGQQARGQQLIATMWQALAALPQRHGTALFWQAGGWTAGPTSFANSLIQAAGLTNIGTGSRLNLEKLLRAPPDFLITETAPAFPSLATSLAGHPALRHLTRININPAWVICAGPYSVQAVQALLR